MGNTAEIAVTDFRNIREAAAWLHVSGGVDASTVGDYVGYQFPAYARVLNPANFVGEEKPVKWSTLAASAHLRVDGTTQWRTLEAAGLPDRLMTPQMGTVDTAVAVELVQILKADVTSSSSAYRAIWDGYADGVTGQRVRFSENRVYFVDCVPLASCAEPWPGGEGRLASRWWDINHSWCVGNDIYARSMFVGASIDTIDRILASPRLEAYPVAPGQLTQPEDR